MERALYGNTDLHRGALFSGPRSPYPLANMVAEMDWRLDSWKHACNWIKTHLVGETFLLDNDREFTCHRVETTEYGGCELIHDTKNRRRKYVMLLFPDTQSRTEYAAILQRARRDNPRIGMTVGTIEYSVGGRVHDMYGLCFKTIKNAIGFASFITNMHQLSKKYDLQDMLWTLFHDTAMKSHSIPYSASVSRVDEINEERDMDAIRMAVLPIMTSIVVVKHSDIWGRSKVRLEFEAVDGMISGSGYHVHNSTPGSTPSILPVISRWLDHTFDVQM
jgi:hypothetical protein